MIGKQCNRTTGYGTPIASSLSDINSAQLEWKLFFLDVRKLFGKTVNLLGNSTNTATGCPRRFKIIKKTFGCYQEFRWKINLKNNSSLNMDFHMFCKLLIILLMLQPIKYKNTEILRLLRWLRCLKTNQQYQRDGQFKCYLIRILNTSLARERSLEEEIDI